MDCLWKDLSGIWVMGGDVAKWLFLAGEGELWLRVYSRGRTMGREVLKRHAKI